MRKTKDQVISEVTSELLKEKDLRLGIEKKNKTLQTRYENLKKKHSECEKLITDKQEALKRAYQSEQKSAKEKVDLEQKVLPKARLAKWLHDISYAIDNFLKSVKKVVKKK